MKLLHCHKHEELNAYSIYTGLHMFPRPGMSRKVVHIIMKLPRWGCLLIVDAPVQKTKDLVKLTCGRLNNYKTCVYKYYMQVFFLSRKPTARDNVELN
ncbi:unnamed protein product [Musa acuminata subsp. burmannicoides]